MSPFRPLALLSFAVLSHVAAAQCTDWGTDWRAGFGSRGASDSVHAFVTHDDGTGPELYLGGRFTSIGSVPAERVARWNGSAFEPLGSGVGSGWSHTVHAMVSFDDGSGAELVVAGNFPTAGGASVSNVARWDGSTWTPLGTGFDRAVYALAVFDSGSGPELYAGGEFRWSGGNEVRRLARWDGSAWQPVAGGIGPVPSDESEVRALAVYQSKLYVGGEFTTAGGIATRDLAAWDGSSWSLPAGTAGTHGGFSGVSANTMVVFDGGSGPELYLGGDYSSVDGVPIENLARYDGSTWSATGLVTPHTSKVVALTSFDAASGVGPALWAAGGGTLIPGSNSNLARFDGSAWTAPGSGTSAPGDIEWSWTIATFAFAAWDRGAGPEVLAGGAFQIFSQVEAWNLASFDGATWKAIHAGDGLDGEVHAFAIADLGSGEALYAGGEFHRAGGVRANNVARWDGSAWTSLGTGDANGVYDDAPYLYGTVNALCGFDAGAGTEMYVGGEFWHAGGDGAQNLARWNGASWSPVNLGFTRVWAMRVHDDGSGPSLFVVGRTDANNPSCTLKRWNGTTATTIGVFGSAAKCLAEFQGDLYVAGDFWEVGTLNTKCFARWDGTSWHAVGNPAGAPLVVECLTVHDDGNGPALYAGGRFESVSLVPARNVVRWDGTSFTALGAGIGVPGNKVFALASFAGELVATGAFLEAGGVAVENAAAWDGASWSPIGFGLRALDSGSPMALAQFDAGDGLGGSLYVGGYFAGAGTHAASHLARLAHCGTEATTFCHGDGSAAACPCGNASAPGASEGCLNSFGLGATLRVHGRSSLSQDTLELRGARMTNSSALYFQAGNLANGGQGFAFGDGVKCTAGPFVRLATKVNAGGASSYPQPGNLPVSVRGFVTAPGTRHYQVHYRNSAAFCAPETFNMTNAVTVRWEP